MLRRQAQAAMERGEPIPDVPGIREAMEDRELTEQLERIDRKKRAIKKGSTVELQNK